MEQSAGCNQSGHPRFEVERVAELDLPSAGRLYSSTTGVLQIFPSYILLPSVGGDGVSHGVYRNYEVEVEERDRLKKYLEENHDPLGGNAFTSSQSWACRIFTSSHGPFDRGRADVATALRPVQWASGICSGLRPGILRR